MGIAPGLVPSLTLELLISIDEPLDIMLQVLLLRLHLSRHLAKFINLTAVELGGIVKDGERWRQLGLIRWCSIRLLRNDRLDHFLSFANLLSQWWLLLVTIILLRIGVEATTITTSTIVRVPWA